MKEAERRTRRIVTTITVTPQVWQLLRGLVERRTIDEGGRPNASAILSELVEAEAARQARGVNA